MSQLQWLALKDRALAACAEGITIADARLPERPLIYVNEGFEKLTGYSADEALGRSCRFLQGEGTDPGTAQVIRRALDEEQDCLVEIRNFRKDGTPFWNRLSITPVRNEDGIVTHFIGIQFDLTKRREAQQALQEANAIMQHDLADAAKIQRAWLPQSVPEVEGYHFAWSFTPCQELGGDSLNIVTLDEDHVGMYVLDVAGHGVGAALLSASIQRWLTEVPQHSCLFSQDQGPSGRFSIAPPALVAGKLNRRFEAEPGKYCTFIYGVLNLRDGGFSYVTAGHPPPLRCGPGGVEVCPLAPGVPIGVFPDSEYKENHLKLSPGDRLLLYTDGVSEVSNADDDMFGEERMLEVLEQMKEQTAEAALASLLDRIRQWGDSEALEDDVTLLLVENTRV